MTTHFSHMTFTDPNPNPHMTFTDPNPNPHMTFTDPNPNPHMTFTDPNPNPHMTFTDPNPNPHMTFTDPNPNPHMTFTDPNPNPHAHVGEANLKSGYNLDIWGGSPADLCTAPSFYGCFRTAGAGGNYLNPVKSASVRTVNSFSFRYGKVTHTTHTHTHTTYMHTHTLTQSRLRFVLNSLKGSGYGQLFGCYQNGTITESGPLVEK